MTNLAAGWYPDPQIPGRLRYWDGTQWTLAQAEAPDSKTPPVYSAVPMPAPATAPTPWYLRKPVLVTGAVVALLAIGAALGDDEPADDDPAPAAALSETTEQAHTVPDEEPAGQPAGQPVEKPAKTPPTKRAPAATDTGEVGSAPAATGDTFTLPNETGKILQAAQDDIQAVSGNPFYVTFSEDATDADRFQMLDSGWQVCSQTPAAGTVAGEDSIITFFVVRVSESCP